MSVPKKKSLLDQAGGVGVQVISSEMPISRLIPLMWLVSSLLYRKRNNGVRSLPGPAAVSEDGAEAGARHTALWYAAVGPSGGGTREV